VPELPDIALYLEALRPRVLGQRVESIRVINPFTLRSFDPPISSAEGREVVGLRRMGKRIVFELEGALFLVIHLMIAGRLRWRPPGGKPPGKPALAAFTFPPGILVLTEAGSKRRASIHLVAGEAALGQFERGGLEVLTSTVEAFAARLRQERHTLKR
jgi:formamidopyrimidine-DNA glycosylase